MKWREFLRGPQLDRFARFLEEHPSFSPELEGEDAVVCGFRTGGYLLTVSEMEQLIGPRRRGSLEAKHAVRVD